MGAPRIARLRAHLEFLADDELEGRLTGTRGYDLAATYMATQFASLGLKGDAQEGSYFQKVPLRRTEVVPEATSVTLSAGPRTVQLGHPADVIFLDTHQAAQGAVRAPVVTSHLDHLGIGAAVDGDAIYNGAFDNASGCALLVEVARAFSQLSGKPRRSVLFAAVTAEEQGLVGSDYLAHHLPVPLEKIVAIVNVDGAIPLSPGLRDVLAFGSEHSSLGLAAAQAAAESGFEVSPDPYPEEGTFVRTDHYPFVEQGIPALFLAPGVRSNDPKVEALEAHKKWLVTRYHSPKDDASQGFDYETGARFARFVGLVGYEVAMESARPTWNEGDFFGKRFGRGRAR